MLRHLPISVTIAEENDQHRRKRNLVWYEESSRLKTLGDSVWTILYRGRGMRAYPLPLEGDGARIIALPGIRHGLDLRRAVEEADADPLLRVEGVLRTAGDAYIEPVRGDGPILQDFLERRLPDHFLYEEGPMAKPVVRYHPDAAPELAECLRHALLSRGGTR